MFTLLQSNNRDPKDINFLTTSLDESHALLQQEDSDQGNSQEYKPRFPWHLPHWMLMNSKNHRRASHSSLFQRIVFPSRPSAFLHLAFIQLGNTHLIAFIYIQKGLLKSKWNKSGSGKEIKPYCSIAQAVYLGCHVMQAMRILLCKRHWEFNVAAQPVAMHLADV